MINDHEKVNQIKHKNVVCKVTGKVYDPDEEMKKIFQQQWFIDIMKRLKTSEKIK